MLIFSVSFLYFCIVKFFIKHSIVLLTFLLISNSLNELSAKSNDSIINRYNPQIEFRPSYGFIITHHQEMGLFRAHFPLFEFSIQNVTYGRSYYQGRLNYPAFGITFLYSGLGDMPEIGRLFALYPFLRFNLIKSKRNEINFKFGIGPGYITEVYDPVTNPKNTFIGAHINATIHLSLEYNRFITDRFSLSAFIGFTHCSNGARKAPNNGINVAHAGISTKYFIYKPKQRLPQQEIDKQQFKGLTKKNFSFYVAFLYMIKDIDDYIGYNKSWSVYNVQMYFMKSFSKVSKLGIGLDFVYDMTDKEVLKIKGIEYNDFEILRTGINISYEFSFDDTSFFIVAGTHLSGKDLSEGYLYQKICAKQNLTKHFFITCALTTHFGCADFFTMGAGFRIN